MAMIKLPGLIDPHVHFRDPGATHKEDWDTGTSAALAGGFTCVCDMPNNTPPITDAASLAIKKQHARELARCDYGIHLGAGADNIESAAVLASQVVGLKMYLDQTFGPLRLDSLDVLIAHMQRWGANRPLMVHAEGRTIAASILVAHLANRPVHICHVARKDEILLIRAAKERGIQVTCEVAPHHFFLDESHLVKIGAGRSEVRPRVASSEDVAALRANIDIIDCFATDHAPHTLVEKDSPKPPPGFPGLETALPLYLELVREGLLTMDGLVARTVDNPRKIFGIPEQRETWVEVDTEATWTARGADMFTRAKWTPFEGWNMRGRVTRVVLRGQAAFEDGKILAQPGTGRDIRE
jgi:carbamoyl-phosphate synthase/aspartate carbamoyltransferase/dihydroorotase